MLLSMTNCHHRERPCLWREHSPSGRPDGVGGEPRLRVPFDRVVCL